MGASGRSTQYRQSSIEGRGFDAYAQWVSDPLAKAPLVAVLDDDPSVLRSLQSLLASSGFRVQAFSSGSHLLAWADIAEARCLIVDLAMPEMSGLEVVTRLRATRRLMPFVVLTASAEHADVRSEMLANGARACLRKPMSGPELLRAVEKALSAGA